MAPAAHNPGMVNGAEVKTLLYAKIHKPRRAPDKPLGRKGMGTPFCPIRHRLATGGHSLSLLPRNGPRARPPPREGACRTLLLFLPLDSATEKAWAMWKFPWSARGTPVLQQRPPFKTTSGLGMGTSEHRTNPTSWQRTGVRRCGLQFSCCPSRRWGWGASLGLSEPQFLHQKPTESSATSCVGEVKNESKCS